MNDQQEDSHDPSHPAQDVPSSMTRAGPATHPRQVPYIATNMHPTRLADILGLAAKDAGDVVKRLSGDEEPDLAALRADMAILARTLEIACKSSVALAQGVQRAMREAEAARSQARRTHW